MPTERFYRLPTEKKRMIREAAKKEFARVPMDKVSINQIIKEADISRGSFYTYFEDKRDVLNYIFEESKRELYEKAIETLRRSVGDIWQMFDGILEEILVICKKPENADFIRNVTERISADEMMRGSSCVGDDPRGEGEELVRKLYDDCAREKYRIRDYEQFLVLFQMAMFSVAMVLKGYYEGEKLEVLKQAYEFRMEILKHGVCI
jgi:AcrR family transcriptional regulator